MTVAQVFQFIGVSLIPIVVAVLLFVGFKHVDKHCYSNPNKKLTKILKTEKSRFWVKQIIIGLVLGGFSIGCYFLSIDVKNYLTPGGDTVTIGISTFFPVLAGFIFGWPAAAITTTISTIFRLCVPSFLRWSTVCACIIGGAICCLASKFLLDNKRSKWLFAFLGGVFVESLNLLFLFLFNLGEITEAYKTIRQFDILCILCNGCVAGISTLIIQIIEKDKIIINIKKDNRLSTRVQLMLSLTFLVSLFVTTISAYVVTYSDAFDTSLNLLYNCAYDMHNDFKTMVSDFSAERCVNRHIVSEGGYVLTVAADKFTLDETLPASKTIDFEKNMIIGVPTAVTRDFGAKQCDYFTFSDGTSLDPDWAIDISGKAYNNVKWKFVEKKVFGEDCLVTYSVELIGSRQGKMAPCFSVIVIPHDEILVSAGIPYRVVLYLDLIIFITLFAIINTLMNRRIIRNISIMDNSLEKIMSGDLNEEVVLKTTYKEFETLSNNINLAVGALKNYAQEVEHRMAVELTVARNIQVGSLPTIFPVEKEYNLYALMTTAKEVGGDFYDYIKMNNGRILILNADVSGKGVPAAMFMMRAKTLFKSLASTTSNLAEIVYNANNVLCEDNESDMFVTAWVGIFNPETGELNYINAGHTVPLIKRNGKFEQFVNKHNVVLAAIPNSRYEVETIYLEPGQEILLYTDGVTEAINERKEMYGMNRLIDVANNTNYFNSKQLLTSISEDIYRFANGVEQFDDITMLMLIYTGKHEDNPENTLTLIAKPVSTTVAINYVESVLASRELNQKFIARISIVIDELFANIAFYAYPKGKEGNATVTIDTRDDMLRIRLIDSGAQFDPTAKEDPDVTASIDERKRGGLGIFIVKNTMDNVKYEYTNFQNILYLDKKITPEDKIAKKEVKEPKGE